MCANPQSSFDLHLIAEYPWRFPGFAPPLTAPAKPHPQCRAGLFSALVFEQSPYSPADRLSPVWMSLRDRRSVKSAPIVCTRRSHYRRPQGHAAIRAGDDKNPRAGGQRADRRDVLDVNARQRAVASGASRESGHLPWSLIGESEKGRPPVVLLHNWLRGTWPELGSSPRAQPLQCDAFEPSSAGRAFPLRRVEHACSSAAMD
jgi:hypothetical protein